MKRLIVMRHAKSSWKHPELSDHERPLNKRGRRDSPRVARALTARGWIPEVVLSSDSVRTRETWARMEPELHGEILVAWQPEFYGGGPSEVCQALRQLPNDVKAVLVLGHNNGWENTVQQLSGVSLTMTTANAVLLKARGSWKKLAQVDAWRYVEVIRPKELDH